jgi:hypothetical protein
MKVPSTSMLSFPTISPLSTMGKNIVGYFLALKLDIGRECVDWIRLACTCEHGNDPANFERRYLATMCAAISISMRTLLSHCALLPLRRKSLAMFVISTIVWQISGRKGSTHAGYYVITCFTGIYLRFLDLNEDDLCSYVRN